MENMILGVPSQCRDKVISLPKPHSADQIEHVQLNKFQTNGKNNRMMQISDLQKIHSQKTVLYSVICTLFAMAKSPSKQLL